MIRVCLFGDKAYGSDVTGWENKDADSPYSYSNLLEEDLIERVNQGDIVMYFDSMESAEDWCAEHNFELEFVENENN